MRCSVRPAVAARPLRLAAVVELNTKEVGRVVLALPLLLGNVILVVLVLTARINAEYNHIYSSMRLIPLRTLSIAEQCVSAFLSLL